MQVLTVKSGSKKIISTVAALIHIHLIRNLDVLWIPTTCRQTHLKRNKKRINRRL